LPTDQHAVAIVGSRNCSEYGRRVTEQLARGLVRSGYTVVSGLARGTDSYAHRAALDAGGRTLAVLAGGLSKIYPPEHGNLADAVARQGALVSEQSMRQAPLRDMFPARNRIISGLSRGVVIIEAGEKSGALITARHALEQGREVFAVPGPIDSPQSAGTLGLLRQGATLIRGVDDILETLGNLPLFQPPPPSNPQSPSEVPLPSPSTAPPVPPPVPTGLSDEQLTIWNALGASPIHLDDLAAALGLAVQQISSQLLMFEMRGLVRRVPGNRYERAR
jgi:DNA processing protein